MAAGGMAERRRKEGGQEQDWHQELRSLLKPTEEWGGQQHQKDKTRQKQDNNYSACSQEHQH